MAQYYGVERSSEYLKHYGIKGMRWGVRKAIEKGNKDDLKYHHDRAMMKLKSLQEKANLAQQPNLRRDGLKMLGLGAGTAGSALLLNKLEKANQAHTGKKTYVAGYMGLLPILPASLEDHAKVMGGVGALEAGIGAAKTIAAHHRMGTKGHEKAVKKVNDWQDAMHETFKGTNYEKKKRTPFNDTYKVTSYVNGKEKTLMSIPGSHLTRGYKGKDKTEFLNKLNDSQYIVPSYSKSVIDDGRSSAKDYMGIKYKKKPKQT